MQNKINQKKIEGMNNKKQKSMKLKTKSIEKNE